MPDYNIPESVIGTELFVPSANDYFTVSADMPNGDSCLVIDGATSQAYKAYQELEVVSPALFTNREATGPWAITFWIYSDSTTPTATGWMDTTQTLFGVMKDTAANSLSRTLPYPNLDSGDYGLQLDDILWGVYLYRDASPTNSIGFSKQIGVRYSTSGLGCGTGAWSTLPTNTWTLVTINVGSYTSLNNVGVTSIYLNDSTVASGTSLTGNTASAVLTNDFVPPSTTARFCIGSYAAGNTGMNGRSGVWKLGKLGFYPSHLNATQRAALYYSVAGV